MIAKQGVGLMQERRTITRQGKFKKKVQQSGEKREGLKMQNFTKLGNNYGRQKLEELISSNIFQKF